MKFLVDSLPYDKEFCPFADEWIKDELIYCRQGFDCPRRRSKSNNQEKCECRYLKEA